MAATAITKKLDRIKAGARPRVLDLFAGCGGLSLGFHAAGFEIVAGVELDSLAAASHALNFHRTSTEKERKAHSKPRDIKSTTPARLAKALGLGPTLEMSVDVIVGGPPCQAFARVGRAKLREVASHPEAFRRDPRASLYLRYLHYVKCFKPLAILVENVPDSLNYAGNNIPDAMCEALTGAGYVCSYTLLNAVNYGVPQMRERMFLIAYAAELRASPIFPEPTHWVDLPRGYQGSRQVALKFILPNLFESQAKSYYAPPPLVSSDLASAVTAEEALGDLPPITAHLEGKLRRGTRRFNEKLDYPADADVSRYARVLRTWPGFETNGGVTDHVIRSLPRDYDIFRKMNPGDQYPEAYNHAMGLFKERLARLARGRKHVAEDSSEFKNLKKQIVPPYDPSKFPNKWRKMERDRPARTLMAHLGKDSYSHIHYDSNQARTISVREAARLQSFPDGFEFVGTMNPAFRQIGNAVPPLLGNALAHAILKALGVNSHLQPLVAALESESVTAPV